MFLSQSITRIFPNILIEYKGCDIYLRNYIYDVATTDVTNIISSPQITLNELNKIHSGLTNLETTMRKLNFLL